MKQLLLIHFFIIILVNTGYTQARKIYDIDADPAKQFAEALSEAKKTSKHVMVQIGGNWCSWCFKFHDFYSNNNELDSLLHSNFVLINVNYNPKNKHDLFKKLEFPERFGFPVIVITDADGKRLHTQNSLYLEDGKGSYDKEKFKMFLKGWTVKAIDPESYKK